jgi:hypothetical protein
VINRRFVVNNGSMQDVATTVGAYFAMWNADGATTRAQQIERAWAASGRYVDPARDFEGHDGLSEMVEAVEGTASGPRSSPVQRNRRAP